MTEATSVPGETPLVTVDEAEDGATIIMLEPSCFLSLGVS